MAPTFKKVFNSVITLFFLMSAVAYAEDEYQAKLIKSKNPKDNVKQLQFESTEVVVKKGERNGETVPVATVKGTLDREEWQLLYDGETVVSKDGDREFEYDFPLSSKMTIIPLQVVNSKGQKKSVRFGIRFNEYGELMGGASGRSKKRAKKEPVEKQSTTKKKAFNLNVGLAVTSVSYSEVNTGTAEGNVDLSMMALTVKAGASYTFSQFWDAGLGGYYTLLPLSTTLTSTLASVATTDTAKFLGLNMRVGYRFGFVKAPASLKLMVGWYFTTMQVTNESFGFTNMAGPQIYPVFSTRVGAKNLISFYAKLSTILGALSLDNREIAGGGAYTIEMASGNTLSFTLDIANISFSLSQNSTSSTVSSTSFSGGVAFGF